MFKKIVDTTLRDSFLERIKKPRCPSVKTIDEEMGLPKATLYSWIAAERQRNRQGIAMNKKTSKRSASPCGYFKSKNWNILFFFIPLREFAKENIRYQRNMPYLWTFYDNIELGIPNTNNEMESLFSWLKRKLNIHNGMSLERRKMLIERLFYARKPSR